jgi:hypothetical protein
MVCLQTKTAQETQFDKETGDMIGGKEVKLSRHSLKIKKMVAFYRVELFIGMAKSIFGFIWESK